MALGGDCGMCYSEKLEKCPHCGCDDERWFYDIQKCRKCKHETTENCWCSPHVEVFENGNKVIIHNQEQ